MHEIKQLELITAILDELAEQGVMSIDQGAMNVIIKNVDNLIDELQVRPIDMGISA